MSKKRPVASIDRTLYVCLASSSSDWQTSPSTAVGRPGSPSHSVRVRPVQTDRLSSVARLNRSVSRRTFDILVHVDRLARSINCAPNAVHQLTWQHRDASLRTYRLENVRRSSAERRRECRGWFCLRICCTCWEYMSAVALSSWNSEKHTVETVTAKSLTITTVYFHLLKVKTR